MNMSDMTDEETVEAIMETLSEDDRVHHEHIRVECHNGRPVLSGRVASDDQIEAIGEILSDVLEIAKWDNHLWVDDTLAFENSSNDESGDDELFLEGEDDNLSNEEGSEEEEEDE